MERRDYDTDETRRTRAAQAHTHTPSRNSLPMGPYERGATTAVGGQTARARRGTAARNVIRRLRPGKPTAAPGEENRICIGP